MCACLFQERARMAPVSYWDVFEHTHALSQTDDTGSVSYTCDHDDKARERYVSIK